SSNQNIVACDSVEVLGNWYFASTNFNDTIVGGSVNGCDLVVIYALTINNSVSTFENLTSCNPADTGVVVLNLTNQFGCDSIYTITTTLLPSDATFENLTSCNPADTSVVILNLTNQFGCDSIHTITTTLNATSSSNQNIVACDSVEVLGNWYFSSTAFNDTIIGGSVNGCDSVVMY